MDKLNVGRIKPCLHCGVHESLCCRQLAAANERAGRMEAEREELTIAFHALEPAATDGRLIALYGLPNHESYKTFARILGGA